MVDNLGLNRNARIRLAIEAREASLIFLPKYSPDLNPIEVAFSKLKALLRKAAERSTEALWNRIGRLIDDFTPDGSLNYFKAAGYGATWADSALADRQRTEFSGADRHDLPGAGAVVHALLGHAGRSFARFEACTAAAWRARTASWARFGCKGTEGRRSDVLSRLAECAAVVADFSEASCLRLTDGRFRPGRWSTRAWRWRLIRRKASSDFSKLRDQDRVWQISERSPGAGTFSGFAL